ncbi:hypothetical protein LTR97_005284 [Elasticomyces elasticus]|uniref:Uncharacterized protein n=1 Tax=Elasticomyces elasticus TaxID=574655 RepID=A0AAN7WBY1_9PEZI|nr:hypothetical protein LTR97_005284 [Elasticomyces elasticus]
MSTNDTDMELSTSSSKAGTPALTTNQQISANVAADTAPVSPTTVESTPVKAKATPKKKTPAKKATPKKRSAAKVSKADDENDDSTDDESPKKKVKGTPAKDRQRKAPPSKPASARTIGRSYEECSEEDKALIDMRDAGKSWTEIRAEWEKLTGDKTGQSTLPNRYSRLKSNFVVIKEEDLKHLLQAKVEVEAAFEKEKWSLVADAMEKMGTEKYVGAGLQKAYKKIMVEHNVQPPTGVQSKDFEDAEEED